MEDENRNLNVITDEAEEELSNGKGDDEDE